MVKRCKSPEESRFAPPKRSSWILPREFSQQSSLENQVKTNLIFHIAIVSPSQSAAPARPQTWCSARVEPRPPVHPPSLSFTNGGLTAG